MVYVLSLLLLCAPDVKEKEPTPKERGSVQQWKTADGLEYYYRIPQKYDAEEGANLVVILHGSNLDKRWGFANHNAKEFRPDDIVVSPDGTTPNGRGGCNFLNAKKDVDRVHDLIQEWKKSFKIRSTILYGHSQGSFFAFLYAGEHPDDVQGVVGHASGVWTNTQQNKKGHGLAIVLMHGTQDPVVPYVQSAGGYRSYLDARYPMVRLRSLEGWNHWPAEHNGPVPHTSQQIAWCEGMTTSDPARMEASFEFLTSCKKKERTDYAAIYSLAQRLSTVENAPDKLKKRAADAMETIEKLAEEHVKELEKADLAKFEDEAWVGHAPMFLRAFMGVPAREAFAEKWKKVLDKQEKQGSKHFGRYWQAMQGRDEGKALESGIAVVKEGYLWCRATDSQFLENLEKWHKDAKKLRVGKKALKDYDTYVKPLPKALKDGAREFDGINRKCGKL